MGCLHLHDLLDFCTNLRQVKVLRPIINLGFYLSNFSSFRLLQGLVMPAFSLDYSGQVGPAASFAVTAGVSAGIRSLNVVYTHVIAQRGDATGDISHVLAALANEQNLAVLVFGGDKAGVHISGRAIADTYVDQFQIAADRVVHIDFSGQMGGNDGLVRQQIHASHGRTPKKLTTSTTTFTNNLDQVKLDAAKHLIRGADFNADPAIVRSVLDTFLEGFLAGQGIVFNSHTIVLWGRRSGAAGGAHPGQDHSRVAMKEIKDDCIANNRQVIFAGDFVNNPALADNIALYANSIYLGQFWNQDARLVNRSNQVRLFHILVQNLARNGRGLVHIGMRSGGLDMYAFSGQNTLYILSGNAPDARMTNAVSAFQTAADDPANTLTHQNFDRYQSTGNLRQGAGHAVHAGFDIRRFNNELAPKIRQMLANI
jgi:hypothetical protein